MKFGGKIKKQQDGEFAPIPKGRYACYLENATLEKSNSGKDFINLTCAITGGDHNNRKLWAKLWLTEAAYSMTVIQLNNLMVYSAVPESEGERAIQDVADLVFKLVGKKIEVEVKKHREYNGKLYEETFVTGFLDIPNEAWQKKLEDKDLYEEHGEDISALRPAAPTSGVDPSEPLPF